MYDSFYHKELTAAQWHRIKFVFEEPARVGRPSLDSRTVFNGVIWMVAIGSSRGGGNTKVHVLINERMQLLRVIDGRACSKIFSAKAYNCEKFRFLIAERGTF